jgi:DNA polymerase-1
VKLAMIAVDRAFKARGVKARMLLQVHDELVFECPKDQVAEVSAIVRECMQGAMQLSVPLAVEVGHGDSWLAAH